MQGPGPGRNFDVLEYLVGRARGRETFSKKFRKCPNEGDHLVDAGVADAVGGEDHVDPSGFPKL